MGESSLRNEQSNNLTQALDRLDTVLTESEGEMSKKDDIDNNNKASAQSEEVLDDLTRQLMDVLDDLNTDKKAAAGESPSKALQDLRKQSSDASSPFGKCASCGTAIDGEASVVGSAHYHPKCFTCADCMKPLGTDKYYIIGGKKYCSQDRHKFLENCTKCGRMIENETIRPKESGKPYHAECFCCSQCGNALQGKYFTTDDGGMLCEECFAASREKCARCGRAIMEAKLKALGGAYHPNCFICSMCPRSLEGVEFFVTEENKPICKDDYARFMAKTCDGCDNKIIDETLVATNNGKHFHRDCFKQR